MTTARKLFGTDGVRGEAGTFLSPQLASSLGRAATMALESERPQVLIVRDTRESGPMLEAALAAGVAAAGGEALLAGVLPTPAAAILVKRLGADLAAVVSASHNPYQDNGIKFFGSQGVKLPDSEEARIESLLDDLSAPPTRAGSGSSRAASATTCASWRPLSRSISPVVASCSTALTGRPSAPPRRSSNDLAPRSRRSAMPLTGATSTTAAAPPTSRRWLRGLPAPMPRSASPSTATAIGCWRSMAPAGSTTATS